MSLIDSSILYELYETKTDVKIRAELPGVAKSNIKLDFYGPKLVISAIKTQPSYEYSFMRSNIRYGPYKTTINFSVPVTDYEQVNYDFIDGILTIDISFSSSLP